MSLVCIRRIIYCIVGVIFLGCTNNRSNNEKFSLEIIDTNRVKTTSCILKIPIRYQLVRKSKKDVLYRHYELINKEWLDPKNILLSHRIAVKKRNELNELDNQIYKDFTLIDKKEYSPIEVYRFKAKYTEEVIIKDSLKLLQKNNTFYIYSHNWFVGIDETDEYVDEIYTMIEDCASQMNSKK